jgi:hypothetical protein
MKIHLRINYSYYKEFYAAYLKCKNISSQFAELFLEYLEYHALSNLWMHEKMQLLAKFKFTAYV